MPDIDKALDGEVGCTCNISDHEDRVHRPGCRFFDQEGWDTDGEAAQALLIWRDEAVVEELQRVLNYVRTENMDLLDDSTTNYLERRIKQLGADK